MNEDHKLALACAVSVLVGSVGAAATGFASRAHAAERPNILFIY
jgi:hypothetical protein